MSIFKYARGERPAYTLFELVFVIVIFGILAAVALPYMATTRDSAEITRIKNDVAIVTKAVPAWYTGQYDARILKAVHLDPLLWVRANASEEAYTWSVNSSGCVTIAIYDQNGTSGIHDGIADLSDINATTGRWSGLYSPVLRIVNAGSSSTLCQSFWQDLNGPEMNITMAGKQLK